MAEQESKPKAPTKYRILRRAGENSATPGSLTEIAEALEAAGPQQAVALAEADFPLGVGETTIAVPEYHWTELKGTVVERPPITTYQRVRPPGIDLTPGQTRIDDHVEPEEDEQ